MADVNQGLPSVKKATVAKIDEATGLPVRKAVDVGDQSAFEGGFGLEERISNPADTSRYSKTYNVGGVDYGILGAKPAAKTETPPATSATAGLYTAQTAGAKKTINNLTAPTQISELTPDEQLKFDTQKQQKIDQIIADSENEILNIQGKGKATLGNARGFLAKAGALGRTISGAPLETNLGVLGSINQKIDAALKEEKRNREAKIGAVGTEFEGKVQARVDALNKLAQTNFDNALKLIQEDRQLSQEERSQRMSDLQIEQLDWNIANGKKEDVIASIENLANGGVPLDKLTVDQIAQYEKDAGLPAGSFVNYYKTLLEAQKLATEENELKVAKARKDLAKGTGGGGGGSSDDVDEGELQKDIEKEINNLAGDDGNWANSYNRIAQLYPDYDYILTAEEKAAYEDAGLVFRPGDETVLDAMLGKSRFYSKDN